MKKIAWIFSVLLTFAFACQLSVGHEYTHVVKQTDTKQYTTKQEVASSGVVKGEFQLQHVVKPENTSSFSPHALVLGNRLVDVFFSHQLASFTKLRAILFSPTFLHLRVLRL